MRKIFALLAVTLAVFSPAMSFGADTTAATLYVTGTELIPDPEITTPYVPAQYDEEGNETQAEQKGVVTFPAISGTNYTFQVVGDGTSGALSFALNPQEYIQNNYTGYIDESEYDIAYDASLTAMSSVNVAINAGTIDYEVDLSPYAAITTITFTATPAILTLGSGQRHFITAGQTVTFSGITFTGSGTGGGVTVNGGSATFTSCTFRDCYATESGGGVSLLSDASGTFTGCTFRDCETSINGGGIYAEGSGALSVTNSSFTSCVAPSGSGGGIYFAGTGTFAVTGTSFTSCTVSERGGGLASASGTVTMSATFTNCGSDNYGGALSSTGGTMTISGASFSGNTSVSGGAISLTGGSINLANTSFTNNTSTNGGAIYSSSSLTVGANVTFNTLTDASPNIAENGGALYIAGGTTTISGAQAGFTENRADYGGAIYISSGTVNVSGSGVTFAENVVSNDGGAIYAGAGSRVNLTGDSLSFTANTVTEGSGGAIYASGDRVAITITSSASEFSGNAANTGIGGAILAGGGASVTVSGAASFTNNIANYGGAVYLSATRRGQTALNITGESEAIFNRNTANYSGGGIYAESYSVMTFEPTVTFRANTANDGNGGALWVAESSQLPAGTIYFESNTTAKSDSLSTTTGSGGGIYIAGSSSSPVTIGTTRKYTFSGNKAAYYGGGLCSYSSDIIFESFTQTEENTATTGGGLAASNNAKITLNNSSVSNQLSEGSGGAVWAMNIVAVSSDFGSNGANSSTGTGNHQGGGALYAIGELTLTQSIFTGNTATLGGGAVYSLGGELTVTDTTFTDNSAVDGGGALYAEASTVTVTNSFFATNSTSSGNGGAVSLQGYCRSVITSSTFRNNNSTKLDGGAVYAQGTLSIQLCLFRENKSWRSGGAIYFNQNSSDPKNYATFSMTTSMLQENVTSGASGNGGGLYVVANDISLSRCTFSGNRLVLNSGNTGEGGGAYLAAQPIQHEEITVTNCTFYDNHIDGATQSNPGGAGLAVHCADTTNVTSCTFTLNTCQSNGGGMYVGDGSTVVLLGTMLVGNDGNVADVWSDGTVTSGGYNRIGVYSTGSGVTDFYSVTRNASDRTPYPSTTAWTKETFFSGNILAVNARSDLGSDIPPYLGSTLSTRSRLMTLMLSEDVALPLADRATNIIPYEQRTRFPEIDERGVTRYPTTAQILLDIGACFNDDTNIISEDKTLAAYTISRIEMSGIPNNLRRVGQTASLIAKIYYTNGRTALGGTGENEEPVEWSSDKPNIISINKDTGDITVLSFTPGNTYVTITVKTLRSNSSGAQLSDSQPIKVTEYTYSYLNTSPTLMDYLQGYVEQLTEYDISLQLADVNSSAVNSSSFRSSFANIWGNVTVSQVTTIADNSLTFSTLKTYSASDGYALTSGKAGVNINFTGLNEGAIFPLVYSWTFSGSELQSILGYNMAGKTLTPSVADEIFSAIRTDFKGISSSWPVIGSGGVKASEAMSAGALKLTTADGGKGLSAELTAYLANVTASATSIASSYNGPQIVDGKLIVPDGEGKDGRIYGAMFMAGKPASSQTTETGTSTNTGTDSGTSINTETENGVSGSSGGGGCESFGAVLSSVAIIFMAKRKRITR